MRHDQIFEIGEEIVGTEAEMVVSWATSVLLPERPDIKFTGSQPVSLDRSNMELLYRNRCDM